MVYKFYCAVLTAVKRKWIRHVALAGWDVLAQLLGLAIYSIIHEISRLSKSA